MNRWALRLVECATFTSKINRGYAQARGNCLGGRSLVKCQGI